MSVNPDSVPSGHFKKILLIVLVMFFMTGLSAGWLITSNWATGKLLELALEKANSSGRLKLEIEGLSGNFFNGIKIQDLRFRRSSPPLHLNAAQIVLKPDFLSLKKGIFAVTGEISRIDIEGMSSFPIASSTIPDYHSLACFSSLPVNLRLASLNIASISIRPWNDFPAVFNVNGFSVSQADSSGYQAINLNLAGDWRENRIASASFNGSLRYPEQKLTGMLNVMLAGHTAVSEVQFSERRGIPELSGHISTATLDVSRLSHWLVPMWQQELPVGFDGSITCRGSWLFSKKVGFLGNLSGEIHNLRAVALGLFISIFELNGSWKLFDDCLSFNDNSSLFFGFPAALTGKIESISGRNRRFDVNFNCDSIDFSELFTELPWGVKYGMAIPELAGIATFTLQLSGNRPEIDLKMETASLEAGKDLEKRKIGGIIRYSLPAKGPGSFVTKMNCRSESRLLPLLGRLKGPHGIMKKRLEELSGPITFSYSMNGQSFAVLRLSGELISSDQCLARATGTWHEGIGALAFLWNAENQQPQSYAVGNIPFLELILAK